MNNAKDEEGLEEKLKADGFDRVGK
ncbi:MAG: hypothetical protein UT61_C0037G0001, partial [Candidatus Woesebacteria bacterium GW2011_GWA1_39_8]